MPANDKLGQITLDDFRPGIYSDWHGNNAQGSAPDGAAQVTGTYGCVASRTGSLIPAPKKVNTQTQALVDADGTSKYPTSDARMHILAMKSMPAYAKLATGVGQSAYPDAPTIVYGWWYDSAGGGTNFKSRGLARIYKMFLSTVATYDMISFTSTGTKAVGTKPWYGWGSVDVYRANDSHSDVIGIPVVCASFFGAADIAAFNAKAFPDQATIATDGTDALVFETLTVGVYALFAHQDRICAFSIGSPVGQTGALGVDFGTSGGVEQTENIFYSDTNTVNSGTLDNNAAFTNESPSGYGSWKSVNASELFLVKKRGGGVSVRNDFDRPTVVKLPGVESTGLAVNIGCNLPDGTYLYGSERGVWAWSGGDTVALLSPQLEGWFWKANSTENTDMASPTTGYSVVDQLCDPAFFRATGDALPSCMGSWAMCGDRLVFGPNNFCYDTMGKGWFRHTDPTDIIYGFHDNSTRNFLIASPYYVDADQTECLAWFDPMQGQRAYHWTSQPLQRSRGRVVRFRDADITLQGTGTVTLTLTGIDASTSRTASIAVDSTRPITINIPALTVQAADVELTITADSGDDDVAAPEIKRVTLNYYEEMTARARTAI